ncbi:MAG: sialate O-acetylesterase [Planctomycetota bacterium]|jgi:sialate O-acetylesterase
MKLTPLLTDHAVLQRHQTIPVWGWSEKPYTRLRASLGTSKAVGISAGDGRFLLRLPALDAGGPYTLRVETFDGEEEIEVQDILIGEVWLASGQSNMQWDMASSQYTEEIRAANPSQIRMINVRQRADLAPQSTVLGEWELSSPESVGTFSAAATFFGNRLQDELNVPVGIIHSSWGGSFIETWISRERLLRNPLTEAWVRNYEIHAHSQEGWEDTPENHYPADPGNTGLDQGWHQLEFDDSAWEAMPLPCYWQEQDHNYSAVIWFRKRIALPQSMVGQELTLDLGAVDKHDITYANGVEIGRTGEGFNVSVHDMPRTYTIPAELTQSGEVVVAVRAYSFIYGGGMTGPAEAMTLAAAEPGQGLPLAGDWRFKVEHNFGFIETAAKGMGHGTHNSPAMCYENMIRPLLPVEIAGAIWYQGESNADDAARYESLLKDLIEDWRFQFGCGDFPFGIVQLTNFREPSPFQAESTWAPLREAQQNALTLPHTGLAVILDSGEAGDIHPRDKKTVGQRLAQWALAQVYGRDLIPSAPLYDGFRIEGKAIRILFRHAEGGLALKSGDRVNTLYIADKGGSFQPAQSAIEGSSLLVWSDDVPAPTAVRYAWSDNPEEANLVNAIRYPAGTFSTETTHG